MMNKRLEHILREAEENPPSDLGASRTCTVWYSTKNGAIYGICKTKPAEATFKDYADSIVLNYDCYGPRPELAQQRARLNNALEHVLKQIREYRGYRIMNATGSTPVDL